MKSPCSLWERGRGRGRLNRTSGRTNADAQTGRDAQTRVNKGAELFFLPNRRNHNAEFLAMACPLLPRSEHGLILELEIALAARYHASCRNPDSAVPCWMTIPSPAEKPVPKSTISEIRNRVDQLDPFPDSSVRSLVVSQFTASFASHFHYPHFPYFPARLPRTISSFASQCMGTAPSRIARISLNPV
jgi:hypothetical protein